MFGECVLIENCPAVKRTNVKISRTVVYFLNVWLSLGLFIVKGRAKTEVFPDHGAENNIWDEERGNSKRLLNIAL